MSTEEQQKKPRTVREIGVTGPDWIMSLVDSENSRLLERVWILNRSSNVQILTAAMCFLRIYIGNMTRNQFIL